MCVEEAEGTKEISDLKDSTNWLYAVDRGRSQRKVGCPDGVKWISESEDGAGRV